MKFETLAIHAGQEPDPNNGAVMTPVYLTSTYMQDGVGKPRQGYEYSRTMNPTRKALQDCLAALEGGSFGLAFGSGLAATDTVLRLLNAGDHVVAGNDVYGGTFRLFDKVLRRFQLDFSFADTTDPEFLAEALTPANASGLAGNAHQSPAARDRYPRRGGNGPRSPQPSPPGRGQHFCHALPPAPSRAGCGYRRPLDDEVSGRPLGCGWRRSDCQDKPSLQKSCPSCRTRSARCSARWTVFWSCAASRPCRCGWTAMPRTP